MQDANSRRGCVRRIYMLIFTILQHIDTEYDNYSRMNCRPAMFFRRRQASNLTGFVFAIRGLIE
jgi:hypothetical protein